MAPDSGGSLPGVILEDGTPTRLVTRYEDVRRFFTEPGLSRSAASARTVVGAARAMSITEMDPPLHTRIRRMVAGAFSVAAVERLRPRIERIAGALADRLVAAGSPADLIEGFCAPLTFGIQCELLGVPQAHRSAIRARYAAALSAYPGATPDSIHAAQLHLYACVGGVVEDKRRRRGEGLFDDLIVARDRGEILDETELLGIATSMFLDGAFLSATQIANSVLCLLARPDDWELLRRQPARLPLAAEELLRFAPAIHCSLSRVATADIELGRAIIRSGETVIAALSRANRDPSVFVDPDRMNPARSMNPHLSFGHGIHYCLAAHLARMELRVGLATLLRRLPGLRLAVPDEQLQRFVTQGARGVLTLPVSW